MLDMPLGAPLGPAARVPGGSGWAYQRDFELATAFIDLSDYSSGRVVAK